MWIIRSFIVIVILLMIVAFAIQNAQEYVDIRVYNKLYENIPIAWVLFIAFVFGVTFWFIVSISQFFSLYSAHNKLKRENKKLLEEIKTIRNMPLQEADEEKSSPENESSAGTE
jgi:uncharacterized integral membrane protein